jgi:hypothetical protein
VAGRAPGRRSPRRRTRQTHPTEITPILTHNSLKNHSSQTHAVGDDRSQPGDGLLMSGSRANRTAAMMAAAITMVEVKRSCVRLSRSSLAIALLISPISAPPPDAAHQETCATVCPGKSLTADSASSFHTTDKPQQSNCLAWYRPGRGWSRRIPYTEWRSRKAGFRAGSTQEQYRRRTGEYMHTESPSFLSPQIRLKECAENRGVTLVGLVRT